eukprot:CAMPEP_0195001248 /NCGR_PEP_ID=MMETSP0326_2-20130528/1181_1 /TAXON_ID=2866 ORGANISM="Crypthecodinium cohnii, Strain Seligo" /NCGR_SAMPLE_ID=MMETSP0326_2 /ASSEMBLY_ACC=CAM_ASM_000348 /LENGTH=309 /DNA_ID=CAMNT_0040003577 /DNA_START=1 /DNA_END=931 /DNA_ORIENTATION=-
MVQVLIERCIGRLASNRHNFDKKKLCCLGPLPCTTTTTTTSRSSGLKQEGGSCSSTAPARRNPAKWWEDLGDCCPLSLTALEDLEYEPFGLLATDEGRNTGVWGSLAMAALTGSTPVHWFDGKFLACTLVSQGQFRDPINMRLLTRGECVSLDEYLADKRLPAVQVAETFDLVAAGVSTGTEAEPRRRLQTLGQEASSLLRIFDEEDATQALAAAVAEKALDGLDDFNDPCLPPISLGSFPVPDLSAVQHAPPPPQESFTAQRQPPPPPPKAPPSNGILAGGYPATPQVRQAAPEPEEKSRGRRWGRPS